MIRLTVFQLLFIYRDINPASAKSVQFYLLHMSDLW